MALLKWQRRTLEELVKADLTIWENLARLEQFGEELHRVSTEEFLKGKCPDLQEPEEQKRCLKIYRLVKQTSWNTMWQKKDPTFEVLYWRATLQLSRFFFKDYLEYMEKNRPFEKKFWLPRRDTLSVVADDLQALEDGKYKFYGLSLPPRVGKALAYDTPILTRAGWKKHGELTILDEVLGPDGKFKKILAIHDPCEMEYKVTFSDGEEIICHGEHEWYVYDRHSNNTNGKMRIRTTDEMYGHELDVCHKKDHDVNRCRFMIPYNEVVEGEKHDLAVDPYTLGAWLGDGRNVCPDICGAEADYAIVQHIIDNGYELAWDTKHKTTGVRYYGFRGLRQGLQVYGMCHSKYRTTKHIPDVYLTATVPERLELLAGLLDTDGSYNKDEHRYQFTTNEPALRDDFISLVSTFSWRCTVVRYEAGMTKSGIHARCPYWVVAFNPTMEIPCQLERKQNHEFSVQRRTAIEKIEKISGVYGNCITVEGGLYLAGRTLKPTHNSTIVIFFLSWVIGKRPNSHNGMAGHSGLLADGFYTEILNLTTTPEYTFSEIFPNCKLESKHADKNEVNFGDPDRFPTLTCRGIDGTWTGEVDISPDGYLYVDDLVRDRTESLSPRRLEARYQDYLNVLVDRKNDGSREIMVGTRWNVMDPLGRVERAFKDDPGYLFRKIPALNENGESNFAYRVKGFSTAYYIDIRNRLDKNEWMAKYQQTPFLREGLLYEEDSLRYFNGVKPEGDHRVLAACDVAWGGGDSLSMPIGYEYPNGDLYVVDWVFNKGTKEVTIPIVVGKIMSNQIRQICFEANNGGDMYCAKVSEELKMNKYTCSCTYRRAPGNMEKMQKMIAYSDDVKRRFIFLEPDKRSKEYQEAMDEFCMTVIIGKNEHDDAADGITQLAMASEGVGLAKVEAIDRLW